MNSFIRSKPAQQLAMLKFKKMKNTVHAPVINREKEINLHTTHGCLRNLLILGKISLVFPVEGIEGKDPGKIQFKFISLKTFLSVIFLISTSTCFLLSIVKSLTSRNTMQRLISPLYYCHIASVAFLNLHLSRKWKRYVTTIHAAELNFLKNYKPDKKLKRKIHATIAIVILVGLCQYSITEANFAISHDCLNEGAGFEQLIRKQYHYIYDYINYNVFNGVFLLILSFASTLAWNFGDLVIITISIIYTSRFNQIVDKIKWYTSYKNRNASIFSKEIEKLHDTFWRDSRRDYARMQLLCSTTSDLFGILTLITYSFNTMFILIQLFVSLRPREYLIEILYFISSFSFVVGRAVMSSIYGGWLYEAGRAALPIINAVPTEMYTEEASTFISQIQMSSPYLTGRKFFTITKGIILSIAASIITFELGLIQFNQSEIERYLSTSNVTICY
ncbi:unnamed protein product [Phyllotreta striolata]|uniref:Gustatory receptor n=1 Tax=Phyllotreta striolata TaxID=444603 RepID=A0A9N9TMN9_PHYSR|nr:unnamed protein product [Phyllotreta striolata]